MSIVKKPWFWIIFSATAFIAVFLALIPKPIDMDLDKVGVGKPALVFIYDPNLVVSYDQVTEINQARDKLGDQVIFLIAKVGDPDGQTFINRYNARTTELLLFEKQGKLVDRDIALLSAKEIMQMLSIFNISPIQDK